MQPPPPPPQEQQAPPPPPPELSASPSHQYAPTAKRPRVDEPLTADFGPVAAGTQRLPAPPPLPPPEPVLNEVEAKIKMGLQPPPPPAAGAPPSPPAAAAPSPPPPPPVKMSIKKSDEGGGIQLMNFVQEKKKVKSKEVVEKLSGQQIAPDKAWVPDATGSAHIPGRAVRHEKRHRDEKLAPGQLPIETQMILKAAADKQAQEAKAPSVTPSLLAQAMERKKTSGRKSKWG